VDAVNNEQVVAFNAHSTAYDLADALGFINKSGNLFSANGANLTLDKSVGELFATGSNYDSATDNPHTKTLAALTGLTFQYRYSDGSNGATGTAITPDVLDDGAGGTTAVGNNQWSVQRIYSFISNNVKIQLGVTDYASKADAISGIASELFVTEPSIAANGLLRGWLVVKKGATDLSDTAEAQFISAGKLGEASAGGGGSGGTVFADNTFRIQDDGDATKQIAFEASGITTATTRTVTMPDGDVDMSGGTDGDTLTLQADGSIALETPSGGSGGGGWSVPFTAQNFSWDTENASGAIGWEISQLDTASFKATGEGLQNSTATQQSGTIQATFATPPDATSLDATNAFKFVLFGDSSTSTQCKYDLTLYGYNSTFGGITTVDTLTGQTITTADTPEVLTLATADLTSSTLFDYYTVSLKLYSKDDDAIYLIGGSINGA